MLEQKSVTLLAPYFILIFFKSVFSLSLDKKEFCFFQDFNCRFFSAMNMMIDKDFPRQDWNFFTLGLVWSETGASMLGQ